MAKGLISPSMVKWRPFCYIMNIIEKGAATMLKAFDFEKSHYPYEAFKRSELTTQLSRLNRLIQNLKLPVLIVIDGWESSGKGYMINELIQGLDPRYYRVSVFDEPNEEERRRPFLWRFVNKMPRRGHLALFDRSYYFHLLNQPELGKEEKRSAVEDILALEKMLWEDDTIVIKFFLHQKEKTQHVRIDELKKDQNRCFMVTPRDEAQYKNYEKYLEHFDGILEMTSTDLVPWYVVSSEDLKEASKNIIGLTVDALQNGVDRFFNKQKAGTGMKKREVMLEHPLQQVDLTKTIEKKEYRKRLKDLQKKAQEMAYQLYTLGIPSVVVFEGMDASGKGGSIMRLTRKIDPRGYDVLTTAAPDDTEKQYHYLWRFYKNFPKKGKMTIFDRSWYGRVLVERIEGFSSEAQWGRAYEEITKMEHHLQKFGAMVLKYYLHIDSDEQLKRFKEREETPDKMYKITEEDWRNRDKWPAYIEATNEMLVRTHTKEAPWIIVEGNDKRYARIKVLETFIKRAQWAVAAKKAQSN